MDGKKKRQQKKHSHYDHPHRHHPPPSRHGQRRPHGGVRVQPNLRLRLVHVRRGTRHRRLRVGDALGHGRGVQVRQLHTHTPAAPTRQWPPTQRRRRTWWQQATSPTATKQAGMSNNTPATTATRTPTYPCQCTMQDSRRHGPQRAQPRSFRSEPTPHPPPPPPPQPKHTGTEQHYVPEPPPPHTRPSAPCAQTQTQTTQSTSPWSRPCAPPPPPAAAAPPSARAAAGCPSRRSTRAPAPCPARPRRPQQSWPQQPQKRAAVHQEQKRGRRGKQTITPPMIVSTNPLWAHP